MLAGSVDPHLASAAASTEKQAQDEIKALRTELEKEKKRVASPPETNAKSVSLDFIWGIANLRIIVETVSAPRPLKGASLANPNKKARKYEALEFESDEE